MKTQKALIGLALTGALALSLAACSGSAGSTPAPAATPAPAVSAQPAAPTPVETADAGELDLPGGLTLTVEPELAHKLVVEPGKAGEDVLVSVSERASVEAGQKLHPGEDWGSGWLFSLRAVDEDTLHQLRCGDMSGDEVLAADGKGTYYLFSHPTDVRVEREGDLSQEDLQEWSMLNEWAAQAARDFVSDNGLTPCRMSNSDVDICLNRVCYMDEPYVLASLEFGGEMEQADGFDPTDYLRRLTEGVVYTWEDRAEAPDGEYVIVKVPGMDTRFDFFAADGNLIRETYGEGNVQFWRAEFADGKTVAGDVVNQWCAALAGK